MVEIFVVLFVFTLIAFGGGYYLGNSHGTYNAEKRAVARWGEVIKLLQPDGYPSMLLIHRETLGLLRYVANGEGLPDYLTYRDSNDGELVDMPMDVVYQKVEV